jgi:gamma-polyglutamate biosynthesis protein CapA
MNKFKLLGIIFVIPFFVLLMFYLLNEKIVLDVKRNPNEILKNDEVIKLLFVGDVMMTRSVEKNVKNLNESFIFPFKNVLGYLRSFDYVISNLEGPIAVSGVKIGSKYSFRMKPRVADALSKANIKIVNLANNHIFDYGKIAFEDTLRNLDKNGIRYFGNSYEPLIIEKYGIKIGFLGFSQFLKHLEVKENKPGIAVVNEKLPEIIKKAKEKVDVLFVSFHWGEEYENLANNEQRKLARLAIDSGADLVIGHHPHVIQDIEKYKDKFIFYSLGNFIFDQNFSKETMIGGGVEVYIKTQTNADFTQTKQTERTPHQNPVPDQSSVRGPEPHFVLVRDIVRCEVALNPCFALVQGRLGGITEMQTKVGTRTISDYTRTNTDFITKELSELSVSSSNQSEHMVLTPIIQDIYFRKFYLNNNFQIEKMSERLVPYELENKVYLLREAKREEEWQKGLMFVEKPVDYDGMIFIFPNKEIRAFWNKNTFLDLEIYWLDDDKIIGKDFLPSILSSKKVKEIVSPKPVNKVIEIIK